MPLLILAGGPRDGETFRSDDLDVPGYDVQSLSGSREAVRDEDADVVVLVHTSIHGIDRRMDVGYAAWEIARDARKLDHD
jgi:hypothetical protein